MKIPAIPVHRSILFIILTALSFSDQALAHSYKHVLLLHSYHAGYKWTDDITAGATSILNRNDGYDLRIEYLDTKRFVSLEYQDFQFNVLKRKYPDNPFDVIFCADNNSLNFVLKHGQKLFPGIPVVFCGINNFTPELLGGADNVTGINEDVDPQKTIDLMLALHPATKRIVVINDGTITGKNLNSQIRAISRRYHDVNWYFPFIYTIDQLQMQMESLKAGDLVLLGSFSRDFNGGLIEYDEVAALVSSNSKVPTYTLWDFYLGKGVVGGYLASGTYQGEAGARLVQKILSGTSAKDLPVVMESPNQYFADFNALQRFHINSKDFPPGTIFINSPPDFYGEHKGFIWSAITIFSILSILSFFLTITIFRRRRAEAELKLLTVELEDRVRERTAALTSANESIAEWQQQMDLLIANLPGMVYRCKNDAEWTMLFLSEGVYKLTGYSPQELIGNRDTSYGALIDPRDTEYVDRAVAEAIEKKQQFTLEYRIITKEGQLRWVWEQGVAVYDEKGEVSHLDGFISDISERKAFELEQNKLATAVQQADELVIITNLEGTIEYANPASERITGYSQQELLGQNPRILKSGKQADAVYEEMWGTLLAGRVWRHQLVNRKKDHTEYVADVAISPIRNSQGELTHFVQVQRDITHQINLEKNLQQAQKLEAMGTLAGGIAHEINTPAQFVTTNLDFLIESFPDLTDFITYCMSVADTDSDDFDQMKEKLSQMQDEKDIDYLLEEFPLALQQSQEGVSQISRIVRSMKQFAHPGEEGKSHANLNESLQNTATVCRNEWKYVADLLFHLDENLPLVPCLQSEMNQVFLNIIVNGAHAIESNRKDEEEKGTITITTRTIDDFVEILISDTGGGIPENIGQRVFDPFFTTKEVGRGTGQGLAIAHRIVTEKHGGELYFESEEGVGTTFHIRLPLNPEEQEEGVI